MGGALVTGGSRGIGRAIAQRLRDVGWQVAVTGTRMLSEVDMEGMDGIVYLQSDVSQVDTHETLVTEVVQRFGGIDVLINNAGIAPRMRADLLDMTQDNFHEVMATNLEGPFFLTQRVAGVMVGAGMGTIVNIASVSSDTASINRGEYCMSKAAMSMMTQLFAVRLAEAGIPVYEVRPGIIRTDMTAGVTEKYDRLIAEGLQPMPRWGMPRDVAEAVCVLCEGRLAFSTGDVLYVDGGLHIKRL